MMNRTVPALFIGLALAAGCSLPDETTADTAYEPIPPGYDWPADSARLQAQVAAGDRAAVRRHGWMLWAGINQPIEADDARPVWWTWPTTTQLFETHQPGARLLAARRAAHASATDSTARPCIPAICLPSPRYPLPSATLTRFGLDTIVDGRHFQNNGDILVATESYSMEAAEAVNRLGYNRADTFDRLRSEGTRVLPGLPAEHVVTKHMYWPVKAGGLTPLPVFDGVPESDWNVYNGYETWERFVAVSTDPAVGPGEVDLAFLFGLQDSQGRAWPTRDVRATVVPIDRFYHQQVDQHLWDQLDANDRAMLDAAMRWCCNQPFEVDDYVVTVAMHINTREIPTWTLQSVWWHDRSDQGPYATDRPSLPEARGPWQRYLLTAAYGIPTATGDLPIAFNPYIELAAQHPVATNCRNCHTRAAWPASRAWYLQTNGPGPLANLGPDDPIFADVLRLDFQWVFSDRVRER